MAGNAAVAVAVTWRRALLVLFALLPLWWGVRDAALFAAGARISADVDWKVRSWGARSPGYRVGYSLRMGERRYSGEGTVAGGSPGAVVPVRYLAVAPWVNSLDNSWWLAGSAVLWLAAAGLAFRIALRKRRTR